MTRRPRTPRPALSASTLDRLQKDVAKADRDITTLRYRLAGAHTTIKRVKRTLGLSERR